MMKSILIIGLFITALFGLAYYQQQECYATGGGKELGSLINPMIDRAIQYLEQGNTDAALSELQDIQNELKDTFELED